MAMEPAAISASPAVTMMAVEVVAPDSPAARAKGTVKPSDMPITISRIVSPAVKCCSTCGVCGIYMLLVIDWIHWRIPHRGGYPPCLLNHNHSCHRIGKTQPEQPQGLSPRVFFGQMQKSVGASSRERMGQGTRARGTRATTRDRPYHGRSRYPG